MLIMSDSLLDLKQRLADIEKRLEYTEEQLAVLTDYLAAKYLLNGLAVEDIDELEYSNGDKVSKN